MEVLFQNSIQSRFELKKVLSKLGDYLGSHGVEILVNTSLENESGEVLQTWKGKTPFQKIQKNLLEKREVLEGGRLIFKCWHRVGILKELIVDVDSRRHVTRLLVDLSNSNKDFEIETQSTGWGIVPLSSETQHPWLLYVLIGVGIAAMYWWN
ncbi:MAG: hypothetical protein GY915_02575 [bacterium]|nr:hypothetical protein [bacterium]